VEAEAVEALKFLWKRKHFEEKEANSEATNFIRSWKWKQKYFTASTSLILMQIITCFINLNLPFSWL